MQVASGYRLLGEHGNRHGAGGCMLRPATSHISQFHFSTP
jgi:hypothetical protein